MIKKHKLIFILAAVSLVAHLFFFFLLLANYGSNFSFATNVDAEEFFYLGKNLFENHVFSNQTSAPFYLNSFRTVGYPVYLAFFRLFSSSPLLPIFFQNLVGILSVLIVFQIGQIVIKDKRVAFLAGLLFALDPLSNYWANIMEPDTILVFLFLTAVYLFFRYVYSGKTKNLYFAAAVLGLATLVKPVASYLPPLFFAYLAVVFFRKLSLARLIKTALFFALIYFVVISPWLARNWLQLGVFDLTSLPGVNFYYYAGAVKQTPELQSYIAEVKEKYGWAGQSHDGHRDIRAEKELTRLSLAAIAQNPAPYLKAHLIGFFQYHLYDGHREAYFNKHQLAMLWFNLSGADDRLDISNNILKGDFSFVGKMFSLKRPYNLLFMVCTFVFGVFYVFVFRGLYLAYRRRRELVLPFLFFLAIFYYIASVAGPWGSVVRYRLPAWPGMLIVFSYAFFVVLDNYRIKKENYYREKNKIVIASGTYLPEVSGQSTFVSGLVKNLPADMAWSVVAYGGKKESQRGKIFIVSRNFWRYLNYWRTIRRQASAAKIIFAQDLVSSGLPAALAKRQGQKLVIRIGGDFLWEKMVNSGRSEVPFSQYYDQPKSLAEKIYLLIYRFVMWRADKIIFNSEWQKGIYQRYFNLPTEKVTVLENPVVLENVKKSEHKIGTEIIFAGRFIPLKNLKRLIEAFRQIETDKKLVLIGDGPQKDELEKLAAKDSRISIEPKIWQSLLFDRLGKSYLLVLPSLSEMNPHIALEALGRRKPVLLTKENGLSGDIRKYFKLIDPTSIKEIKESIEYFLNQENYDEYVGSINNKYPVGKFAEYLAIFKNL